MVKRILPASLLFLAKTQPLLQVVKVVALSLEPGGNPFFFGRQNRFISRVAVRRKLIF